MAGRNFGRDLCDGRRPFLKLSETQAAPANSMAIGLDHIPESLFPLLASRWLLPLNVLEIMTGVTIFVVGAVILSPLLFKLNLRDEPY